MHRLTAEKRQQRRSKADAEEDRQAGGQTNRLTIRQAGAGK